MLYMYFWSNLTYALALKLLKFLKILVVKVAAYFILWKEEVPVPPKSNICISKTCYFNILLETTLFPHLELKIFDYGVSGNSASVHLGYRSHLCCNTIWDKSFWTLLVVSLTKPSVAWTDSEWVFYGAAHGWGRLSLPHPWAAPQKAHSESVQATKSSSHQLTEVLWVSNNYEIWRKSYLE